MLDSVERKEPLFDVVINDMIWIEGGAFAMGSNKHYPEEAPVRRVTVEGFWIDPTPVTNAQFTEFVRQTGHVTFAEIPPRAEDYPGALPEMLKAGSLLFKKPPGPVDLRRVTWWHYCFGADWRHPEGPESNIEGREEHPVVHVTYSDAEAYAKWAGKELATEAEWEYAARGGLDGVTYSWGRHFNPGGKIMANVWQGEFPWQNLAEDGYDTTSPVKAFPPNDYGLYDMIGNTWEWTSDWYSTDKARKSDGCCAGKGGRRASMEESYDPRMPEIKIPRRVLKGGSFLCAPNYCVRYRPAARIPEPVDTSTNHLSFRCVRRR
jgi:formylglycine-generating enzyme required for sulfatase activity